MIPVPAGLATLDESSTSPVLYWYVTRTNRTPEDIGFLLAKASQRFNRLLMERFATHGFDDVRPSFGSILVPLFDEDGLRLGELAERARLSKQSMTGLVKLCEQAGLVRPRARSRGRPRLQDPARRPAAGGCAPWRSRSCRAWTQSWPRHLDKTNHAALRRALKGVIDL